MKKAQNLIEVSLVLVLVVVVSLALWPMFNNSKMKLAGLTKTNLSTQSISARQVQLKNNTYGLASDMGLTINENDPPSSILPRIKDKLDEQASAGANNSTTNGYNERYTALVNEQAAINALNITVNDNTTIAGAQGGKVSESGNPSVTKTTVTGHYAHDKIDRSGDGTGASNTTTPSAPSTTGTTADSGVESSTYAIKEAH